jgi:hypothetical protein
MLHRTRQKLQELLKMKNRLSSAGDRPPRILGARTMFGRENESADNLVARAVAATRRLPLPAGPSAAIELQTLAALREAAARPKVALLERVRHMPWISKATAALAMAASLLLVYVGLLGFTGGAPAFADVLQKMRQAKSMVCDFVTTYAVEKGQLPSGFTNSPQRGTIAMNFEGAGDAQLIKFDAAPGGQMSRFLYLGDKAFVWAGGKVQAITLAEAAQRRGTGDWLSRLLKMRESPDRTLGEETINGRRAVGFEIAGWKLGLGNRDANAGSPSAGSDWLRVWVDAEQDLPVRLEFNQRMDAQFATVTINQRWDNIKWNVPLDPADFQPPSAEEVAKTVAIPPIDEAAFVDGLRTWLQWKEKAQAGADIMKQKAQERNEKLPAEMTTLFDAAMLESGYPQRLDAAWLSGAFSSRATLARMSEMLSQQKPLPVDVSNEERAKLAAARAKDAAMAAAQTSSDAMLKAQLVAAFYQKLVIERRDPEYLGSSVKPGDSQSILLQWRLDDGRRRMIYGDLQAKTLDSAD